MLKGKNLLSPDPSLKSIAHPSPDRSLHSNGHARPSVKRTVPEDLTEPSETFGINQTSSCYIYMRRTWYFSNVVVHPTQKIKSNVNSSTVRGPIILYLDKTEREAAIDNCCESVPCPCRTYEFTWSAMRDHPAGAMICTAPCLPSGEGNNSESEGCDCTSDLFSFGFFIFITYHIVPPLNSIWTVG